MPHVTLRTGFTRADGSEETLVEYLCDWPDCPEVAVDVLGVIRELRVATVLCARHAAIMKARATDPKRP